MDMMFRDAVIDTALRVRHHHRHGRGYHFKTTGGMILFLLGVLVIFLAGKINFDTGDESNKKMKDVVMFIGVAIFVSSYIVDAFSS